MRKYALETKRIMEKMGSAVSAQSKQLGHRIRKEGMMRKYSAVLLSLLVLLSFSNIALADDHGNWLDSATSIVVNSTTVGSIETADDYDFFIVDVPSSGTLTVYSTGNTDTYGYLRKSTSSTMYEDDDSGDGANFRFDHEDASAGMYYIAVSHSNASGTGDYQLVVEFYAPHAASYYVDIDATGNNDGSSWTNAFNSLYAALAAASSGDEIWVAEGSYIPGKFDSPYSLKNGVEIYGGFDPGSGIDTFAERDWLSYPTTLKNRKLKPEYFSFPLDHIFYHPSGTDLDSSAVLDGFFISGGKADGSLEHSRGGGMYNDHSSPTIRNCTFSNNSSEDAGGGMYNYYSSPTIINCTFHSNSSANHGGGMYNFVGSPRITDCTFTSNTAVNNGGGMYNAESSPTITACEFFSNSSGNHGGGMLNNGGSPTINGCTFTGNNTVNTYANGGGIWNGASSSIINCTFSENAALSGDGGGIYFTSVFSATVSNCIFSENDALSGGGMYVHGNHDINHCTFNGNSASLGGGMTLWEFDSISTNCSFYGNSAGLGGGIFARDCGWFDLINYSFYGNDRSAIFADQSHPTITNSILWGSTDYEIVFPSGSSLTASYSNIDQSGYAGSNGNIRQDPLFEDVSGTDPANWDLRMQSGSPCIDVGDNTVVPVDITTDLDGNPRFSDDPSAVDGGNGTGPIVDMGAYEAAGSTTTANVNISVTLQGSNRPDPAGWEIPVTIGFFPGGADVLNDTPIYEFNLTTNKSGVYAVSQCTGVAPGTYDIAVVSDHTLMNVKRGVVISEPSTAVYMGTLLEGDCNNDGGINLLDFGILKADYSGQSAYADFDCDGTVTLLDFGLFKSNYSKTSPIEVP